MVRCVLEHKKKGKGKLKATRCSTNSGPVSLTVRVVSPEK